MKREKKEEEKKTETLFSSECVEEIEKSLSGFIKKDEDFIKNINNNVIDIEIEKKVVLSKLFSGDIVIGQLASDGGLENAMVLIAQMQEEDPDIITPGGGRKKITMKIVDILPSGFPYSVKNLKIYFHSLVVEPEEAPENFKKLYNSRLTGIIVPFNN